MSKTDLVKRLRDAAQFFRGSCEWPATADAFAEAADEIERLRAALKAIKALTDTGEPDWNDAIGDHVRAALTVKLPMRRPHG